MTLHDAIRDARRRLEAGGIDSAEAAIDAELLARHLLGWDRARLLASALLPLPDGFAGSYVELVERRERREPAAYIVGYREFWNRDFEVRPGVLVPRPETELIVEESLERMAPLAKDALAGALHRPLAVADVGTGSGCLAVTLSLELPHTQVVATDLSSAALRVARLNAARHNASDRIRFIETDLLAGVDARFDLIVSNPPYVPASLIESLPPEVRDYEPHGALAGGEDGLGVVRRLLLEAESRLNDDALLIFEFGFGQDAAVRNAINSRPALHLETIRRDLQGIPRTAVVCFHP